MIVRQDTEKRQQQDRLLEQVAMVAYFAKEVLRSSDDPAKREEARVYLRSNEVIFPYHNGVRVVPQRKAMADAAE